MEAETSGRGANRCREWRIPTAGWDAQLRDCGGMPQRRGSADQNADRGPASRLPTKAMSLSSSVHLLRERGKRQRSGTCHCREMKERLTAHSCVVAAWRSKVDAPGSHRRSKAGGPVPKVQFTSTRPLERVAQLCSVLCPCGAVAGFFRETRVQFLWPRTLLQNFCKTLSPARAQLAALER